MTPNLVYVVVIGVLFATGVSMLLERSLTRVLMGVILLGNGVNLLILLGGKAGAPPIVGDGPAQGMADPLPQIMILTAIVITLGMTAFLLALAYRSWALSGHDEVQDDQEDRRIMQLAEDDEGSGADDDTPVSPAGPSVPAPAGPAVPAPSDPVAAPGDSVAAAGDPAVPTPGDSVAAAAGGPR